MKRSQLSIFVLLAVLVVCGAIVAAPAGKVSGYYKAVDEASEDSEDVASSSVEAPVRARPANRPTARPRPGAGDPKSGADELAFLADPNAVGDRMKAFAGLDSEVGKIGKSSQRAMRGWTRPTGEDNLMLARSVHEQVMQELTLIHKLAKEEGAQKTLAAVEGLMVERAGRYDKMFARMEDQRRKRGRRGGRGYRGGRRGGRYDDMERNGRRGRYDNSYDRRGGRYDDRRSYRDSRSGSGQRRDDDYEDEPRQRR